MKSEHEIIKVVDNKEQIDWWYGGGEYIIDDDDIAMLKAGKIINFSVNQEYGCALIYAPKVKASSLYGEMKGDNNNG